MGPAAVALPLLKYLPALGAGLGGVGAYKQSGGDLGATALGAGLGALSMGGVGSLATGLGQRLAGTGLMARVAPEAYKAGQAGSALLAGQGLKGAGQALRTAGTAAPLVQQFGGQQVLAKTLPLALAAGGALALAPGAGQMAAQAAGPVRKGAEYGAGNVMMPRTNQPQYNTQPLPSGTDTSPYGSVYDVYGPDGFARSGLTRKSAEDLAYAMDILNPRNFDLREATSKADFARQAAMKQIAQNVATRAAMLQNAQVAGINAGQQALTDSGRIMGQIYQYQ